MNVPVLDLKRQYESIRGEVDRAVLEVIRSAEYVLGPHVKAFEEKAAAYCGAKHAIGVASGTDALLLSLRALGVGQGDAVILPSFTFFATAGVAHNVGAEPVFCDIDPRTFNIDPGHVREILRDSRVAAKAKAIIPVHLYGQIADMREILDIAREYGLGIVEDAAQAIGATIDLPTGRAKAGTIGDLSGFSFYPTKNLSAYGDGGMVTTMDEALGESVRLLRVHGAKPKYFHRFVGYNSRLDALQAAVLAVKLGHLDRWAEERAAKADVYDDALREVSGVVTPYRAGSCRHVFHQYTIRVLDGKRDALQSFLKGQGIGTTVYYPRPLHLQECFAHLGYKDGQLPASEAASKEVLSLPIFPELTEDEQAYVCEAIRRFPG